MVLCARSEVSLKTVRIKQSNNQKNQKQKTKHLVKLSNDVIRRVGSVNKNVRCQKSHGLRPRENLSLHLDLKHPHTRSRLEFIQSHIVSSPSCTLRRTSENGRRECEVSGVTGWTRMETITSGQESVEERGKLRWNMSRDAIRHNIVP
jgi:hypothetical protein